MSSNLKLVAGEELPADIKCPDVLNRRWRCIDDDLYPVFICVIHCEPLVDEQRELAIISPQPLPNVSNIRVHLRTLANTLQPISVSFLDGGETTLTHVQMDRLCTFHQRMFAEVVSETLLHTRLDFRDGDPCYLIAPVSLGPRNQRSIEWPLVASALRGNFGFRSRRLGDEDLRGQKLHDMVLINENNHHMFFPIRVRYDLCGASVFNYDKAFTYKEYYRDRYNLNIRTDLPLVEAVGVSSKAYNALDEHTWPEKVKKLFILVPDTVFVHRFSMSMVNMCRLLPSIMSEYTTTCLVAELCDRVGLSVDQRLVRQSLTTTQLELAYELERMEYLGDAFLKCAFTTWAYFTHPHWQQDRMTLVRSRCTSNETLGNISLNVLQLHMYLMTKKFDPYTWEPPGFPRQPQHRKMSIKMMADVFEAMLGAYYVSGGVENGLAFLKFSGLSMEVKKLYVPRPIPTHDLSVFPEKIAKWFQELPKLEEILQYKFNDRGLILQACTHGSLSEAITPSYQQLECVGDAVIDLCVTEFLFQLFPEHGPGELTVFRRALVNNDDFGLSVIRHRLARFVLRENIVDETLRQYENGVEGMDVTQLDPQLKEYLSGNENGNMWERQAWGTKRMLPKLLGDFFEAVLGAVFVDSKQDLTQVWKVFDRLTDFTTLFNTESARAEAVEKVMAVTLANSRTKKRRKKVSFAAQKY